MEDCAALALRRQEHNSLDVMDLWVAPGRSASYLHVAGLFEQNRPRPIKNNRPQSPTTEVNARVQQARFVVMGDGSLF